MGFNIFQEAVRRLHARYDHLIWMKLSEIARYWAAKELTRIERQAGAIALDAPFACPGFTLFVPSPGDAVPRLRVAGKPQALEKVSGPLSLRPGTWARDGAGLTVCFDLPKGESRLEV